MINEKKVMSFASISGIIRKCDKKKVTTYFLRCQALGLVNDKKDHSNVRGGVCTVDPLLDSV